MSSAVLNPVEYFLSRINLVIQLCLSVISKGMIAGMWLGSLPSWDRQGKKCCRQHKMGFYRKSGSLCYGNTQLTPYKTWFWARNGSSHWESCLLWENTELEQISQYNARGSVLPWTLCHLIPDVYNLKCMETKQTATQRHVLMWYSF
jgi:hypothetical protein